MQITALTLFSDSPADYVNRMYALRNGPQTVVKIIYQIKIYLIQRYNPSVVSEIFKLFERMFALQMNSGLSMAGASLSTMHWHDGSARNGKKFGQRVTLRRNP